MNVENYIDKTQNSSENIKTLDQLLEKLKTPEELSEYMRKNIEYGFVGKENNKVYSSSDIDFDVDFEKEYFLQPPEQLLNSKNGLCWDQVELERQWFLKQKFDFKTYFLMFVKEESNNLPTHTFLTYKNKDKFYWFENSFEANKGIHEYENFDALIEDVKKKQFDYARNECDATDNDFKDLKYCEYEMPRFGASTDEFITNIIDHNSKREVMRNK